MQYRERKQPSVVHIRSFSAFCKGILGDLRRQMAKGTLATEYICTLINSGLRWSGCYEVVTIVEVRGWLYTQAAC